MNDSQAIQKLKKGDISGLEFLIAHYQSRAFRAAVLILGDEALAEDVVQETFLRIYHHIHQFDVTRAFEPYLMHSITHAALNVAKKEARQMGASKMVAWGTHKKVRTALQNQLFFDRNESPHFSYYCLSGKADGIPWHDINFVHGDGDLDYL